LSVSKINNFSYLSQIHSFISNNILGLIEHKPIIFPYWINLPYNVDQSLKALKLKSRSAEINISSHIISHLFSLYPQHLQIYTDASKNVRSNVGTSICIPALDFYTSYRLSDNISVFAAEFFAIYKALEFSSHCNFSHIVILLDSIKSLNDIKFKTSKLFPTLLNLVTSLLSSCTFFYTFCYVPSHCNYLPHDLADSIGKKASFLSHVDLNINLEFYETFELIYNH